MKQLLVLTLLFLTTFIKVQACITKTEALDVARLGIESHNNSIDNLREDEINLEDVLHEMEFNGFRYIYSTFINNYTVEDITVSCDGKFSIDYYFED